MVAVNSANELNPWASMKSLNAVETSLMNLKFENGLKYSFLGIFEFKIDLLRNFCVWFDAFH